MVNKLPRQLVNKIVTVSGTLAGLALHSRLKIDENKFPRICNQPPVVQQRKKETLKAKNKKPPYGTLLIRST